MAVIDQTMGEKFALYNGDSAEVLASLPDGCVDLSVYSPPFAQPGGGEGVDVFGEVLRLIGAAGRVGLGVEIEHDLAALEPVQRHAVAAGRGHVERGGLLAFGDVRHSHSPLIPAKAGTQFCPA